MVKIGDSLKAPEDKIHEPFKYSSRRYLIGINLGEWEDDFLSLIMVVESIGPDGNEAGADSSQANLGHMEPHFIGMSAKA